MKQLKKEVLKEARDRIMLVPEDFDDFLLEVIDLTVANIVNVLEKEIKEEKNLEVLTGLAHAINLIEKL